MTPAEEDAHLHALYDELRAGEAYRRYEAAILIGHPELSGVSPRLEMAERLLPLLDDPHDHVRYYASVALGKLGYDLALEPLRRRLEVEQRSPRPLGLKGLREAIAALEEASQS